MELKVGQVWEDFDIRQRGKGKPRRIVVVSLLPNGAYVRNTETGRLTAIMAKRFKPTATGYRLVSEPKDSNV